ncbi:MAG: V-type ATP synthase subunit I [Actinomycetota bacterium]|nr:V-type ATP synthase subunit I [Actinomycetota bacterium]
MLVRMSKIEIVGARDMFFEVLHKIHELGCMSIEDVAHQAQSGRYIVRPMDLDEVHRKSKQELEEALVKVSSIIASMPPAPINPKLLAKQAVDAEEVWQEDNNKFMAEVRKTVSSVEEDIKALSAEKRELLAEQGNLARYQVVMTKVAPLVGKLVTLENYDSVALLVEKKFANLIEIVRQEVDRITASQSHMVADDVDEQTVAVLLVFHNKYARQVKSFISGESVNEVIVPENLQSLPYDEALRRVAARRKEIPKRLEEVDKQLKDMSRTWYFTFLTQKQVLRDKLDEFDVLSEFGATDYTFVIVGWLPTKHVAKCKREFNQLFGDKLFVEELAISEHEAEDAPIQYIHSAWVRPFEPLVQMFGTPRYGTVDPVPLVAVFFPLFFGIILGDMGYALVLLAIAFYLRFKQRANQVLQAISIILFLSGPASFFFGFLYGEFFGDLGYKLGVSLGAPAHVSVPLLGLELPWNRRELLTPTLLFAVGLGTAHIILGLALGVVNGLRGHHKKHALEKGATLVALVALAPIIYKMLTGLPNSFTTPGWLLLIAAVPVLFYSAGIMGPIEVLGTLSNIVSYARIMAIGLVSVILAETANEMARNIGKSGEIASVVLGIFIALLIHALNLTIHVFTPSLHVLRLNFVEFFGKFYESGGKEYKPFKRGGATP